MTPPREPLLTRPFVLVWLAHFLHALAYNLYLHVPGFLKERGASELEIGVLFGVPAGTAILARPLLGRAIDAHGRSPVIVAGGALAALVCALYLTVSGLGPWVYAVRIGHGLAEAMLFASIFAFVSDLVPASRRIEGIAVFGVSGLLPTAIAGLLGDAILTHGGYRELFATSAACAFVALLLSLPLRDVHASAGAAPSRGIAAAFAQRDLLPLWLVGLTFAIAVSAPFTFMKTFVMKTGTGTVGPFFASYAGAAVALRVLFASLPERLGPKRVLFPALALMAAGLALLAWDPAPWARVAAGLLCGVGHGYTFPILLGLVVTRARAAERGAALSIFTALFDGGALVGGPLFGKVAERSYPGMFATAAVILGAGAAAFAAWDRRRAR